jgi:hypothetical protein
VSSNLAGRTIPLTAQPVAVNVDCIGEEGLALISNFEFADLKYF